MLAIPAAGNTKAALALGAGGHLEDCEPESIISTSGIFKFKVVIVPILSITVPEDMLGLIFDAWVVIEAKELAGGSLE